MQEMRAIPKYQLCLAILIPLTILVCLPILDDSLKPSLNVARLRGVLSLPILRGVLSLLPILNLLEGTMFIHSVCVHSDKYNNFFFFRYK